MADDDLKDWSKNDLIREVRRLRSVTSDALSRSGTGPLMFESGVNVQGKPFVRMWWGDESGQITVDEAYQHARHVMETAAAADFDAALLRLWTEKMDVEPEQIWAMLVDLRNYRGHGGEATKSGSTVTKLRPTERPPGQEDR